MWSLLILLFCGAAQGQLAGGLLESLTANDYTDTYRDVTFEYHDAKNVLLAKTMTECYFVRVDLPMEQLLLNSSTRYQIEDKIYSQIQAHRGEQKSSVIVLGQDLQDFRAALECALKQVWEITIQG